MFSSHNSFESLLISIPAGYNLPAIVHQIAPIMNIKFPCFYIDFRKVDFFGH